MSRRTSTDDWTKVEPSLLIYIPTYNRPQVLRRQLDALASQRGDWPGRVRVLVSDNASTRLSHDEARALAAEYDIEVHRNGANIHANANIALGFVFARSGEYLWILSDDDTVRDGALKAVAGAGLLGDPDAIAVDTRVAEPTTVDRTWREGWSGVGETGLISNVIYRFDVFAAQASQAFYYHNTGFPHLAVMLSTLKEQGSLRFRILPRDSVFLRPTSHREEGGDYSLSLSGMPQLAWLLPHDEARRFCRLWLHDQGAGFIRYRASHPGVHDASRAALVRFLGVEGGIKLLGLAIEMPFMDLVAQRSMAGVRAQVPDFLKRRLRRFFQR